MLRHVDIWRAIDRLAAKYDMTPSGLARRAGLDPTTFNKSKRASKDGKKRWPSTESLSKILDATGASLAEFLALLGRDDASAIARRIPVIGYAQAGDQGYFDDAGYPTGGGWDELLFPDTGDPHAYALEISGDSMEPLYRDGDTIIVSPGTSVRRGDRVVVRTHDGEVMAKELIRRSALKSELKSINPAYPNRTLRADQIDWMARIVWASQ